MRNSGFICILILVAICFLPAFACADNQAITIDSVKNQASLGEMGNLAGLYWCVAPSWSAGTINLLPNGTYQMNGMNGGHYKAQQGLVHFDGTLKSWNNGVALIENGNLIFRWQNSDGSKQYFAYRKGGG